MRRILTLSALTGALVASMAAPAQADITTPYGTTVHATPECIFETNTVILRISPPPDEAAVALGMTNPAIGGEPVWTEHLPGSNLLNYQEFTFERMGLPWETPGINLQGADVQLHVHYFWGFQDAQGNVSYSDISETLPDPCYL